MGSTIEYNEMAFLRDEMRDKIAGCGCGTKGAAYFKRKQPTFDSQPNKRSFASQAKPHIYIYIFKTIKQ